MRLSEIDSGLSEAAWQELKEYFSEIEVFFGSVAQCLEEPALPELQVANLNRAQELNEHANLLKQSHLDRLREGSCSPLCGMIFSDVVVSLRRIKNHLVNVVDATQFDGGLPTHLE